MKSEMKYRDIKKVGQWSRRNLLNRSMILIFIITGSLAPSIMAQEFKYYTQYMFNGLAINPAYAGVNEFITITGDIRKQWVGIEGAPSAQTLGAHSPIMDNQFGLGLLVINDKIGVTSQQEVSISYAYKLKFPNHTLSLGMKLGFNTIKNKFDELVLDSENDINFQDNVSAFLPVFGLGAYLKSHKYYVGLSIPHLYKFVHKKYQGLNIDQHRMIFLTGGYIFRINNDFKVRPSVLTKTHFGSVFEFDLNANVYYKDDYCIGLSYKSLNSLAIIMETGIQKTYYIGYSYDLATTKLIRHQSGTHELSINVYLNKKDKSRIVNPRYF
jgi:type IX secretion system PorP/SprF family membrane protein